MELDGRLKGDSGESAMMFEGRRHGSERGGEMVKLSSEVSNTDGNKPKSRQ